MGGQGEGEFGVYMSNKMRGCTMKACIRNRNI